VKGGGEREVGVGLTDRQNGTGMGGEGGRGWING